MDGHSLSADQFVVLVARHERRVRSFIATLVFGRVDWIDEILQSTYLVAWQKLSSFRFVDGLPDEELVRWMCTIARFESLSYLRKQSAAEATVAIELVDCVADYQLDHAEDLESRYQSLRKCLERLSDRQRTLLQLRYWNNLSIAEIATRQERRTGAVYTALCKIRKGLERCIASTLREEGLTG